MRLRYPTDLVSINIGAGILVGLVTVIGAAAQGAWPIALIVGCAELGLLLTLYLNPLRRRGKPTHEAAPPSP
jgi:hypothetical protein